MKTVGNKNEVWHGQCKHTASGLTKSDLMLNSKGKVVSKKQHMNAKNNNNLKLKGGDFLTDSLMDFANSGLKAGAQGAITLAKKKAHDLIDNFADQGMKQTDNFTLKNALNGKLFGGKIPKTHKMAISKLKKKYGDGIFSDFISAFGGGIPETNQHAEGIFSSILSSVGLGLDKGGQVYSSAGGKVPKKRGRKATQHGGDWWDSLKEGFMMPVHAAESILPFVL